MSSDFADLGTRITAAMERLGQALEGLAAQAPAAAQADAQAGALARAEAETKAEERAASHAATLAALEEERAANARLTERVQMLRDRQDAVIGQLERTLEKRSLQLDAQTADLHRLRKSEAALREALRAVQEAALGGGIDAHMINKAMLAELEALRAARQSDAAELSGILAEIEPLLSEAERANAGD